MSELVYGLAASHAPMFDPGPDPDPSFTQGTEHFLRDGVDQGAKLLENARPDVVLIFGASHHQFHVLSTVPAFTVGVGTCFGIHENRPVKVSEGDIPVDREMARMVVDGLMERDFDVSTSLRLEVDHGFTQGHQQFVAGLDVPIVPLMINAAVVPQPSLKRCMQFGRAVRSIIESDGLSKRVAVIGSGGLSHWGPDIPRWYDWASEDDKEFIAQMYPNGGFRSAIVNRPESGGWNSIMAPSDAPIGREHSWNGHKRINKEFDAHFLDLLARCDWDAITAYSGADIEREAGLGGQEIRCWVAAAACAGGPATTLAYAEITEWDTGCSVATFDVAQSGSFA